MSGVLDNNTRQKLKSLKHTNKYCSNEEQRDGFLDKNECHNLQTPRLSKYYINALL